MTRPVFYPTRRGGRVVECGGLENRLACIRSRGFESLLLRQFICVPVALKAFDGAIVFKPHIVKVSLAGHVVGRADGVCSRGLDGYLAVGR